MPALVPVQLVQPNRCPGMSLLCGPDVVRAPLSDTEDIPVMGDGPAVPLATPPSETGSSNLPFANLS